MEVIYTDTAIVKIMSSEKVMEPVERPVKISGLTERGVAPWGKNNDLPQQVADIIGSNPVAMAALEFKIDVTFGSGVKVGRMENGKFVKLSQSDIPTEIREFFDDNDIQGQVAEIITDLHWFSNSFVEIILNRDNAQRRKIVEMSALEAMYSRLEVADNKGVIRNHYYTGDWQNAKKDNITATPVVDGVTDMLTRLGRRRDSKGRLRAENKFRYVLPLRLASPGKVYYADPYYYSIIKSGWLDFSNAIPRYKKAYMQNMMSVRYIVEISDKYFPRIFNAEGITDKKDQLARKRKEIENINQYLRGVDAAGKTMITYFRDTPNGKEPVPEIRIKVLKKNDGGEFIEDSHEASAMIYTAMRVHPSLIGVIPGKTTSNLSGSDKRELLRIQQSLQGRIRNLALKPLYLAKRVNGWDEDIVFAFEDVILTTLDQGREIEKSYNV